MNESIERIKDLDYQIGQLLKIIDKGTYLAAGICIDLTIGAKQEDEGPDIENISLGLTADCEGILNKILQGLQDSRKWWETELKSEVEDAAKFLEGRK